MRQKLITPPTAEPVSLVEAKTQIRVDSDFTTDDTLIGSYIAAARDFVEQWTARKLVAAGFAATLDYFERETTLPYSPVRSVDSITYVDTDGTTQTLAASVYQLDTMGDLWRIRAAWGESWPATRSQANAVTVNFTCGYVAPFTVVAATDILTWSNRTPVDGEVVQLSNTGGAIPTGLAANTNYYVRDSSGYTCKLAATSGGAAIDVTGAGTGTNFIGVMPPGLKQAVLFYIAHLYKEHEPVNVGNITSEIPFAMRSLLNMASDWRAA